MCSVLASEWACDVFPDSSVSVVPQTNSDHLPSSYHSHHLFAVETSTISWLASKSHLLSRPIYLILGFLSEDNITRWRLCLNAQRRSGGRHHAKTPRPPHKTHPPAQIPSPQLQKILKPFFSTLHPDNKLPNPRDRKAARQEM
jgi:hypothetical protein